MPSARELLEEVDALMRRNRAAMADAPAQEALATPPNDDIPVLTDVAAEDEDSHVPPANDHGVVDLEAPDVAISEVPLQQTALESMLDDVPLLTDAVEFDEQSPYGNEEEALIGGLPAEAFGTVAASIAAHAIAPPDEQARLPAEDPRWATLAEDIRMQVLQRVDLFTDKGLSERLQPHLQGIVERASAELVSTINAQVGQVLRAYVAEAIEREIEKWREDAR